MTPDETRIHAASAEISEVSQPTKSSPSNVIDEPTQQRQLDYLASFLTLPFELQQNIVALACGPPTIDRWTLAGRSNSCTAMMVRLLYAAKVFYPLVTPLLYSHVRLTRPSTLHAFARTLCDKPSLGELLESLHIGEDEELPLDWWPVRKDGVLGSKRRFLRLDLGDGDGQPWRSGASLELDTPTFEANAAKAHALRQAFRAATKSLRVSLDSARYEGPPRRDYRNEWCINVFHLKAVMELYYLETLRVEQVAKDGIDEGQKRVSKRQKTQGVEPPPAYPRLRMVSAATQKPLAEEDGRGIYQIDHTQFLERLRAPGSPTDSFNHPCLFARSGDFWLADGPDRATHVGDKTPHSTTDEEQEGSSATSTSEEESAASAVSTPTQSCVAGSLSDQWGGADFAVPPPMTVGENLDLARRVLSLASQVRSLSVTGLFELAVAGEDPPLLSKLQSLTIGPRPTGSREPLDLTHRELNSVVKLRLCDYHISDQVETVLGKSALQGLTELQWSMMLEYRRDQIGM